MAVSEYADVRKALTRSCAAVGVPVSGIFELTPRCNLQCKMCYVRLTPDQMRPIGRELSAAQWIALAEDAKAAGTVFLLITGGEPTLRSDFAEIYEQLANMGFSIAINTNATLLTEELRSLWRRFPPAQVNVTLYGVCKEDYQALCGDASAFDRVVDGLRWLKEQGILIHLNTTMVPQNLHSWHGLECFARDMGLELRMTTYCFPPVRRENCNCHSFSRLEPEVAAELIVKDIVFREGIETAQTIAKDLNVPPKTDCGLEIGEPMQCLAGRAQFWMTWNGTMTACGMLDYPCADPLEQGFTAAWEQIKAQTASIRLCPECVGCSIRHSCMNCAAVTYTETRSFQGKPEYMCQLNRNYRKLMQELLESSHDMP
jgi:MoaA/NifB/PqqE/SkfB family radical SAM enzyme